MEVLENRYSEGAEATVSLQKNLGDSGYQQLVLEREPVEVQAVVADVINEGRNPQYVDPQIVEVSEGQLGTEDQMKLHTPGNTFAQNTADTMKEIGRKAWLLLPVGVLFLGKTASAASYDPNTGIVSGVDFTVGDKVIMQNVSYDLDKCKDPIQKGQNGRPDINIVEMVKKHFQLIELNENALKRTDLNNEQRTERLNALRMSEKIVGTNYGRCTGYVTPQPMTGGVVYTKPSVVLPRNGVGARYKAPTIGGAINQPGLGGTKLTVEGAVQDNGTFDKDRLIGQANATFISPNTDTALNIFANASISGNGVYKLTWDNMTLTQQFMGYTFSLTDKPYQGVKEFSAYKFVDYDRDSHFKVSAVITEDARGIWTGSFVVDLLPKKKVQVPQGWGDVQRQDRYGINETIIPQNVGIPVINPN